MVIVIPKGKVLVMQPGKTIVQKSRCNSGCQCCSDARIGCERGQSVLDRSKASGIIDPQSE